MLVLKFPELANLKGTLRTLGLTVSCWFKEVESGEGRREREKERESMNAVDSSEIKTKSS